MGGAWVGQTGEGDGLCGGDDVRVLLVVEGVGGWVPGHLLVERDDLALASVGSRDDAETVGIVERACLGRGKWENER